MLLKCRYLSQFSMADLAKNAGTISKALNQCPFMMHAQRTLVTSTSQTNNSAESQLKNETQQQQQQQQQHVESSNSERSMAKKRTVDADEKKNVVCTNTINCPFFQNSNIDLNKLLVEQKTDNSNEITHHVTKENFQALHDNALLNSTKPSHLNRQLHHHNHQVNTTTTFTSTNLGGHHNHVYHHQQQQQQQQQLHESQKKKAAPHHPLENSRREKHIMETSYQKYLDENNLFNYDRFFEQKISDKKKDGSYRYFKKVLRHAEKFPYIQEHVEGKTRDITIWCSNDYLGLGRHPYVQSRITEAVMKYGAGSGGTRNISGSTPLHDKLESELAKLHQKEAALLFTSCYVANDTTLFTMAKMLPHCHILSDAGNHASMIQGIRNSGIPKTIFRHNDYKHLEEILRKLPVNVPKIVAFESVHSMDGSICDMERMCDVTHKYGGIAYIDEVHAVGLYGQNGGGVGERDQMLHKMDIITGTLGKAFGNIGGYIAGSSHFVDTMRSYGAGFIFTTSLPPSVAAGALAALEVSRSDEGRELRRKHQLNASMVKQKLVEAGLPVMNSPSHIVPIMVGNPVQAGQVCDRLMSEHGIYIQSINYPTVARGEERLRIVPNPHHTRDMIDNLVESLVRVWQSVGLKINKQDNERKTESN